jgi:hypothetical protein
MSVALLSLRIETLSPRVVVVAVGQYKVRHTVRYFAHRNSGILEDAVAAQKWIDQDIARAGLDAKAGMAEPRNLHCLTYSLPL